MEPCTLDSPRSALTPPPATPMLPSRSWMMDMARMFCTPTLFWVQPIAYMMVPALSGAPVDAKVS